MKKWFKITGYAFSVENCKNFRQPVRDYNFKYGNCNPPYPTGLIKVLRITILRLEFKS